MHADIHTYILYAYPREIHRVELTLGVDGLHVNLTQDRFDFELWLTSFFQVFNMTSLFCLQNEFLLGMKEDGSYICHHVNKILVAAIKASLP